MARVSTYLNFERETEEAFMFYKSVFGTEFIDKIHRMGDVPMQEGQPSLSEEDKNLIMNITLPILGGHILMGSDAPKSMGLNVVFGNNIYINLEPDSREETEKIFNALSEGGQVEMALQDMFWGSYFGSCKDKFSIKWMFNCSAK